MISNVQPHGTLQQVFLSLWNAIQEGESIVSCKICGETFKAPMMLQKCSHVFCSLCIRRWFDSNSICPECRIPSSAGELCKVRLVEDFVELWDTLPLYNTDEEGRDVPGKKSRDNKIDTPKRKQRKKKRNNVQEKDPSHKIAECPICGIHISIRLIQHHVDICLTKQSCSEENISDRVFFSGRLNGTSSNAHTEAPLESTFEKRPTTLWYKNLSDRKLKDILQYYGLSTRGDRNMLIRRHKEFVFRYNAELDSKFPRPVSSVIKDIEEWEKQQEWNSISEEALNPHLETTLSYNEEICHIAKSDFESLVQQAKKTMFKTNSNHRLSNLCLESINNEDILVFTQQEEGDN
ncbi:E3 ubiquitin-protein ligase RAD18 [Galdieria sulphuraria]|nr:E3 ubiquitin-protein ligase RAD18 [Galdieria sulphuraria]